MDSEMLTDQCDLVELIEAEGWEVTDLELTAYESPWADEDDPEASVTITARKPYTDEEGDDGDDDSPFKIN
ncbi:hypothetical protein [Halovivax limisalsi]|uniref:hypothetical protein n=1 Tax=Halovivax limisalsi TaxID=1453760 RepID=UPI001FFC7B8D|nr:hypothetical protein [Halovivax limisalsi]